MCKRLIPLLLPALLAGCASLADLPGCPLADLPTPAPHVFGGTRSNLAIITGHGGCKSIAFMPCSILDFPLSVVMDLALLPVTGIVHLVRYGFGSELSSWTHLRCPECRRAYWRNRAAPGICPLHPDRVLLPDPPGSSP